MVLFAVCVCVCVCFLPLSLPFLPQCFCELWVHVDLRNRNLHTKMVIKEKKTVLACNSVLKGCFLMLHIPELYQCYGPIMNSRIALVDSGSRRSAQWVILSVAVVTTAGGRICISSNSRAQFSSSAWSFINVDLKKTCGWANSRYLVVTIQFARMSRFPSLLISFFQFSSFVGDLF